MDYILSLLQQVIAFGPAQVVVSAATTVGVIAAVTQGWEWYFKVTFSEQTQFIIDSILALLIPLGAYTAVVALTDTKLTPDGAFFAFAIAVVAAMGLRKKQDEHAS